MPKPYSLDLRERVVRFVEAGRSRHAAAAHFGVSVSFVVLLMRHYRATGSLAPRPSGGRRHSKLDPHRAFLLGRVAEKDDITMPELVAELAVATGVDVAPASISRWLIRNGFSFKKNASGGGARSSRHQQGTARVADQAPATDAARAAQAGVHR